MSDITIKREDIPSALKAISAHQHKTGDRFSARVTGEAATYIRDLERNLDERAKEVGELRGKLDSRLELLKVLGSPWLPCPICHGIEGCDHSIPERARRYLTELEGAEPEPEAETRYALRIGTWACPITFPSMEDALKQVPAGVGPITITPVTRPKTRKVTFWLNVYPNDVVAVHKTRQAADMAASSNRLGGRAIPVTIDVEE